MIIPHVLLSSFPRSIDLIDDLKFNEAKEFLHLITPAELVRTPHFSEIINKSQTHCHFCTICPHDTNLI